MHQFKSSPLLTFQRKVEFNRKVGKTTRKRVRIQLPEKQKGIRNPLTKLSVQLNFLPQDVAVIIGGIDCLTTKMVSQMQFSTSTDFTKNLSKMKTASRKQQIALDNLKDSLKKGISRAECEKQNEPEPQNLSHFYEDDSRELFPITEIDEVSLSAGHDNNFMGPDSTDTEKPKHFCFTENLIMERPDCDLFFMH